MKPELDPVSLRELLPTWRARLVLVLLLGSFLLLVGRSLYLQSVNEDFLQKKGAERYSRALEIPASRGRVVDRNGEVLAQSAPVKSIWMVVRPDDKEKGKSKEEDLVMTPAQSRQLAGLLGISTVELEEKRSQLGLGAKGKKAVLLKRQVAPEVADQIAAMNLKIIEQRKGYRRYYPLGETTAHLLGFTDVDDKGVEGIEFAFEGELTGQSGSRRVVIDRRRQVVEEEEYIKAPLEGGDVTLAMDSKVQHQAFSALRDAMAEHKAKAGGIVVLDVRTGEVLALVNMPTYNPNKSQGKVGAQTRNRALTDTFEPGSTMKPFTAAMALESGRYRPESNIQTAPGRMTIGSATISDAHPHGMLTLAEVIQKSSNVGAAKIALEYEPEVMWRMFDNLGFGQPLKLGLAGEAAGRLRPFRKWKPIEQATMSYGHGISVNLLQLAQAYLPLARDGDSIPLALRRREPGAQLESRRIFTPQTARSVRHMLELAVQPGGTAPKAQIPGYRVAGKTGTSHKLEDGVYTNKYVSSFVGMAPASDPRLIVAVMVDEPSNGKHYGGEVAAPVFAQVMVGALRTLGVAPDAATDVRTDRAKLAAPAVPESM